MEKKHVYIKQETEDFVCKVCKVLVRASSGIPCIIETNKSIIHTWDYGHRHIRRLEMVNGEMYSIDNYE